MTAAHASTRMGRRLAAVLAADVVGYSRLMGVDEDDTLARLRTYRAELIDPLIAKRHGRIVKTTGDGLLVEFGSVLDAVECAVEVQQRLLRRNSDVPEDRRILFRMGINTGDIVVDGDDIQGDGVNVAARLEAMAEPGGLLISADAYSHMRSKAPVAFDDLGARSLKNIDRPVQVFRARLDGSAAAPVARTRHVNPLAATGAVFSGAALIVAVAWFAFPPEQPKPPTLAPQVAARPVAATEDLRPALIVLPFTNLSNDPEQEYFSDGFTEDLTTALSRIPGFLVTARNTAFTFKGKPVNAKDLGRELGVRYVLEGSIRKQGDRLRLNAQLIETATGNHVWAEKFDRPFAEIFVAEDEIADKIVGTVAANLKQREGERSLAATPEKLEAYELTMRARIVSSGAGGQAAAAERRRLYEQAIERDPAYAPAYTGLTSSLNGFYSNRWTDEFASPATAERMVALSGKAIRLAPNDPEARIAYALALTTQRRFDEADAEVERVLALNPGDTDVLSSAATVLCRSGQSAKSVELNQRAKQLDPFLGPTATGHVMAWHLYKLGRYDEAIAASRNCLERSPTSLNCHLTLTAILAQTDRIGEARALVPRILSLSPGFTVSQVYPLRLHTHRNPADADLWADGLRKAGVPE